MNGSTLPLRFRRFLVALALTSTLIGLVIAWGYIVWLLPHGWNEGFAIGSVIVLFCWVMSADTGDDPL